MEKNDPPWQPAVPGRLNHSNEVHIWRAFLDLSKPPPQNFLGTLSADELSRASRFRFEKDQRRFIGARGILRQILGAYLQKPPHSLQFHYGTNGKPTLACSEDTLQFNLSHSNNMVLYAITHHRNIGIDLERIREDLAIEEIANRFFSEAEIVSMQHLTEIKRNELFFQYWTRKEALIKATGIGLSFPVETLDVSSISRSILSPLLLPVDDAELPKWHMQDLRPGEGYKAAIVVEGGDCCVSYWEYGV